MTQGDLLHATVGYSHTELVDEIDKEIGKRRYVYAKLVAQRRMTKEKMEHKIGAMFALRTMVCNDMDRASRIRAGAACDRCNGTGLQPVRANANEDDEANHAQTERAGPPGDPAGPPGLL